MEGGRSEKGAREGLKRREEQGETAGEYNTRDWSSRRAGQRGW